MNNEELKGYVVAHNWENKEGILLKRADQYEDGKFENLKQVTDHLKSLAQKNEIKSFKIMEVSTGKTIQLN